MTGETRDRTGTAEGGHHAGKGAAAPRRMVAKCQQDAVRRLSKAEPIALVPRELGVTAAELPAGEAS
jgi:hypothetical protein